MLKTLPIFLCGCFFFPVEAVVYLNTVESKLILKIMREHPESLRGWRGSKIYLAEDVLYFSAERGAFVSCHPQRNPVHLPSLERDEEGFYLLCQHKDSERGPNKEAEEHYSRAREALLDALGHSAVAGMAWECPPVAVYEGYNAVKAWKEMAREYNAGVEAEERGMYFPPEPKSSRDD